MSDILLLIAALIHCTCMHVYIIMQINILNTNREDLLMTILN